MLHQRGPPGTPNAVSVCKLTRPKPVSLLKGPLSLHCVAGAFMLSLAMFEQAH